MNTAKHLYVTACAIALLGLFGTQPVKAQNASQPAQVDIQNVQPTVQSKPLTPAKLAEIEQKLLGKHKFSLQWISWERFGVADITRNERGVLEINAEQALNGDFVRLKGSIGIIGEGIFYVTGEVVTQVSHMNNGQPCARSGTFEFQATGKRKYWRMQQMQNPCDSGIDYIDIFF